MVTKIKKKVYTSHSRTLPSPARAEMPSEALLLMAMIFTFFCIMVLMMM